MNFKDQYMAVIGVSGDVSKYGNKIFRDLLKGGYKVDGINPKGGFVLGKNLYKSLSELPEKPDMVITVVHPEATEKIVEECNRLGVPHIWFQPGSESEKALKKAAEYGIQATSACFMVSQKIWQ